MHLSMPTTFLSLFHSFSYIRIPYSFISQGFVLIYHNIYLIPVYPSRYLTLTYSILSRSTNCMSGCCVSPSPPFHIPSSSLDPPNLPYTISLLSASSLLTPQAPLFVTRFHRLYHWPHFMSVGIIMVSQNGFFFFFLLLCLLSFFASYTFLNEPGEPTTTTTLQNCSDYSHLKLSREL